MNKINYKEIGINDEIMKILSLYFYKQTYSLDELEIIIPNSKIYILKYLIDNKINFCNEKPSISKENLLKYLNSSRLVNKEII